MVKLVDGSSMHVMQANVKLSTDENKTKILCTDQNIEKRHMTQPSET